MKKNLIFYGFILLLFTACDSCSEEVTGMHMIVQGSGGASVADISYREGGRELNKLRNYTLDWFRNSNTSGGAYLLCAWNKSGVGKVKTTIEVSLKKTCTSRWWDIDYDSENESYDINYETDQTENYTTRKITGEDSSQVCINYGG